MLFKHVKEIIEKSTRNTPTGLDVSESLKRMRIANRKEIILDSYKLFDMPQLGIFSISLKEAADIVTLDMFYSGKIDDKKALSEISKIGQEDAIPDGVVLGFLGKHASVICKLLKESVKNKEIPTIQIRRNFNSVIDENNTYVNCDSLETWLLEHNYVAADYFFEFIENRKMILGHICAEIKFLQIAQSEGNYDLISAIGSQDPNIDDGDVSTFPELYNSWKFKTIENKHINDLIGQQEKLAPYDNDANLSKRPRRTMLTIIGALCNSQQIDFTARGAAQRIREATERLGCPVDDETIKKILNEIPDALASRTK